MPDQPSDQDWQHQQQQHHQSQQSNNYIPPMPVFTNHWTPQTQAPTNTQQNPHLLGMTGMDRRYFHEDTPPYLAYSSTVASSNNIISPCFPAENAWSDMDIGTPSIASNFESPQEPMESYIPTQSNTSRLQPPPRVPSNGRNPHAHAPSISPQHEIADPMSVDRPTIPGRSQTEPSKVPQASKASKSPNIKASASDESDEDFVPSESNQVPKPPAAASNRGRKRQRIPHTAVERRYRENLNAHLERLRQTVPSLASRRASGGLPLVTANNPTTTGHRASDPNPIPAVALLSDGAKPSKCEILNGAIEHIGAVERENAALRDEVKELRARVEDLQRWYSATLRVSSGGGGGVAGVGGYHAG